jgi:NitT/TauT family transport system ATP-binding protein
MITFNAVGMTFPTADGSGIRALSKISLAISRNEFVCVVGPSGCGKSTLLRLIAGLLGPTEGQVAIEGTAVSAPRKDLGFVFQSPTLLSWSTVLTNVLFPLRLMSAVTDDAIERAKDFLAVIGLEGFENRYPGELSGGMQQRVAICRALLHEPSILLMDEPFGALDALTREEIALELLRIWEARPKTVVFVTHSIPEAVLLADRIVIMSPRPGEIKEIIDINLPRPRSFDLEQDPAFYKYTRTIRDLIFGSRIRRQGST